MKKLLVVTLGAVFALSLAACGSSDDSGVALSPQAAEGKKIASRSCMGCHTTNGKASSGPTWKGLNGRQVTLADGRVIIADDAYIAKAIADPDADLVEGYPKTMGLAVPKGSFSDDEVKALVAYINTLK